MTSVPNQLPIGDILLVDDTPANLRLLSTFLTENNYKVRSVINGQMALTAAASSPPDLILLDITMPDMDGYEVAKKLKLDPATTNIPIIFISALNEAIDKVKAFSAGGVDYITKPFQFEEVLARVKTHITLSQLQKQLAQSNETLEKRVEQRAAELVALNTAYEKFVPGEFLQYLNKTSITEVGLGDQMQQEMTILFSDIRNFTSLSEIMSPQENINFLNAYLGKIGPVIRHHNGFIDKYIGDGIMALFPKNPEDAVNAAVAMQKAVHEFNDSSRQTPIQIGVGLHTGPMMIGIIGEEERMQSTVISDAVNMAARLEGLTKYYGISLIISDDTMLKIANPDQYNFRCIDNVQLKGRTEGTQVYEIFDGDIETEAQIKASTKTAFEEGLFLYYAKNFAEASVQFNNVLQANPNDLASKIYLERSAKFMVEGVPTDWNGVTPLQEK